MRQCLYCDLPIPEEVEVDEPYCSAQCFSAHIEEALTFQCQWPEEDCSCIVE
jgi:hypothetical protein